MYLGNKWDCQFSYLATEGRKLTIRAAFQPMPSYQDGVIRVEFSDPMEVHGSRDLEIIVDLDEFDDPSGIEVIGLQTQFGPRVGGTAFSGCCKFEYPIQL
jgi:hypothetical protein